MAGWMREHGYVEGRNLKIEYRYHRGQNERIRVLAAEFVALAPEVIVVESAAPALAVRAAAPNIPLVFHQVADPVGIGLVKSLA